MAAYPSLALADSFSGLIPSSTARRPNETWAQYSARIVSENRKRTQPPSAPVGGVPGGPGFAVDEAPAVQAGTPKPGTPEYDSWKAAGAPRPGTPAYDAWKAGLVPPQGEAPGQPVAQPGTPEPRQPVVIPAPGADKTLARTPWEEMGMTFGEYVTWRRQQAANPPVESPANTVDAVGIAAKLLAQAFKGDQRFRSPFVGLLGQGKRPSPADITLFELAAMPRQFQEGLASIIGVNNYPYWLAELAAMSPVGTNVLGRVRGGVRV